MTGTLRRLTEWRFYNEENKDVIDLELKKVY